MLVLNISTLLTCPDNLAYPKDVRPLLNIHLVATSPDILCWTTLREARATVICKSKDERHHQPFGICVDMQRGFSIKISSGPTCMLQSQGRLSGVRAVPSSNCGALKERIDNRVRKGYEGEEIE